ncbi:MAG: DUF4384 domain-containing protein, partial [Desulfobacterales bacterium]|nr:DUF4384 domain-containing protein [Desulfobacterales bacterium]
SGEVLAGHAVEIPARLVDPDLLKAPQREDPAFMADLTALDSRIGPASFHIALFTQKGRNNLSFGEGESVVFYLKSERRAFAHIFNRDSAGEIYQIFPNGFFGADRVIEAHQVVTVPGPGYDKEFEFTVAGALGNEIVFVYASDEPLPEPPGSDSNFYGIRKIHLSADELQAFYARHAERGGVSLARDKIAIRTVGR